MTAPKKSAFYALAFSSGFVVLSLEILAFRILAPAFGNSIFVSGSVITVILSLLSLGYWVGGLLADRKDPFRLLAFIFGSSTVTLILILFGFQRVLDAFSDWPTVSGALAGSLVLFGYPVTVLSFCSPCLIRLHSQGTGVGSSAGNVAAVSTLGSIAGSLLTTFWLVPFWGVQKSIFANAALLLLSGLWLRPRAFGAGLAGSLLLLPSLKYGRIPALYYKESPYNTIFVIEDQGRRFLRLNQNRGMHSSSLDSEFLTRLSVDDYLLGPQLIRVQSLLILGGAAGTSAAQFRHFYPMERMDLVEIDPEVTRAAPALGLSLEGTRLIFEDARRFLKHCGVPYDMIEVDLFAGSLYIPTHVATREFFRDCARVLSDRGLLMMNVVQSESDFAGAIGDTLASVFPRVFSLNGRMLVAFKDPGAPGAAWLKPHVSRGRLLTDDRSDLDWRIYRFQRSLPS